MTPGELPEVRAGVRIVRKRRNPGNCEVEGGRREPACLLPVGRQKLAGGLFRLRGVAPVEGQKVLKIFEVLELRCTQIFGRREVRHRRSRVEGAGEGRDLPSPEKDEEEEDSEEREENPAKGRRRWHREEGRGRIRAGKVGQDALTPPPPSRTLAQAETAPC